MYDGKATDLPTANPALMSSCLHLFPVTNFFCFSHIDNHTHRLIISEIIPYPVKKHDHLVTHSKNGTQMNYQSHNPSQPALHLHFTKFRNSTITSYCRHRAPNTSATTYQRWVHVTDSYSGNTTYPNKSTCSDFYSILEYNFMVAIVYHSFIQQNIHFHLTKKFFCVQ